jgi:hypothetical protein
VETGFFQTAALLSHHAATVNFALDRSVTRITGF